MNISPSTHLSVLQIARPRFYGADAEPDLLRISHDGKKMLVRGAASIETATESGQVAFLLKELRSTRKRGVSPDASDVIEFLAIHHKTSERVFVRGVIEKVLKSKGSVAVMSKKKRMTSSIYAEELKRVQAARLTQTDALVNIQFIAQHTGRAFSSIYRDVKKKLLPEPFKQGGSSRWSFSDVEAYAHGTVAKITRSPC
ncbi:hypothetical protein WH367_22795 [Comamonas sp. MYb21]|uniref:helix-turn-helix transcriptional regulator n=1 Tax=Comamonas sp. MYb21 TaxID=1848648 RepID=UPI0030A299F7